MDSFWIEPIIMSFTFYLLHPVSHFTYVSMIYTYGPCRIEPILTALTFYILHSISQLTYTSMRLNFFKLCHWTSYILKFYRLFKRAKVMSSCSTLCTLFDNHVSVQHIFCLSWYILHNVKCKHDLSCPRAAQGHAS